MGPVNALAAHGLLGSGAFLPIHRRTFNLAVHPWDEPAEAVLRFGTEVGTPLVMPRIGQPIEPAHAARVERVDPWWRAVAGTRVEPIEPASVARGDDPLQWLPD